MLMQRAFLQLPPRRTKHPEAKVRDWGQAKVQQDGATGETFKPMRALKVISDDFHVADEEIPAG